jgi:hypothetical protein
MLRFHVPRHGSDTSPRSLGCHGDKVASDA